MMGLGAASGPGRPLEISSRVAVVVETDDALAREIEAALGNTAREIRRVETGREASALLATIQAEVVVLDTNLPDVDGLVLLSELKTANTRTPIVLVAVDWVGIANGGQQEWRSALADAAATTPDRVVVHSLHQHDAPGCDFDAESLLAARGLSGAMFHVAFAQKTIDDAASALQRSLATPKIVTHLGVGIGRVGEHKEGHVECRLVLRIVDCGE